MPYIIDGHNLIPKTGLRLDAPDDELELVMMLQEFLRLSRREADVYFDGAPPGQARTKRFSRVTAHFVPLGTTADSAIKRQLRILAKAARNWIVVSSDRQVQAAAQAAHAGTVSSEAFGAELRRVKTANGGRRSLRKTAKDDAPPPEEIEEWLRLFAKRK